ncbi:hypothetical protein LO762_16005 [Actinocorallia sp. API 0066]|uniref:hypothetical protein n=1 Tax=Actinocorallia sp. API 0066 TaxID=2896846 RepID=UPI001E385214|nr:hypothetical protein [Actinocorallia sp. API 0066]MCD0450682.1 hypothetical protein [Actinocorallia sp. API 0066]
MLTEAAIALAAAGGTGLVQAMAEDGWAAIRDRAARLFGRGDTAAEQEAGTALEQTRAELSPLEGEARTAAEDAARDLWTARWRALLEADANGTTAAELRALFPQPTTVNNARSYHDSKQINITTINGNPTFKL